MSFGGSPSDIIIVINLAAQLYHKCKTAGGEYLKIRREVAALHTVLRHLKYEIVAPESLLNRDKSKYRAQLTPIITNCDYTLQQLDELLRKHSRLADVKPGRERFRFGSAEMDTLGDGLSLELNNHKTTITVFLDTVQLRHSADVSMTLDNQAGQLDIILDKVDKIASRMGQRTGSMLTTYGNDDKEVWKEFKRELVAEGFSSDVLQQNKDILRAYIREIDQKGLLVEAPLTPVLAIQSVSPWLESVTPGEAPDTSIEHDLPNDGMKEIVADELNMKFPQSIKKERVIPGPQERSRDIQHGIAALAVDNKADGDHIKSPPVLRLSAPDAPNMNMEPDNSSSDESYTSKPELKALIIRTSDVTHPNFSIDEAKFLKAPQRSLQQQSHPGDRSRSSSPASIHSQTSNRSQSGSYPFEEKTAELSKNQEYFSSSTSPTKRSGHSRSPGPSSVSLAPDSLGNPIPSDAKWTKIRRSLVSLEVLEQDGHRYEARPHFVAILGVLSHQQIKELALRTKVVRDARRQYSREVPSQHLPRKPPQNFRYARAKKSEHNVPSSDEDDSISSSESDRQRHSRHKERRQRSSRRSPINNDQSQITPQSSPPSPHFQAPPPVQENLISSFEPDRRRHPRHKERHKRSPQGSVDNVQSQIPSPNLSSSPNFQPPPAMWAPTTSPPGWQSPLPVEPHPYHYAPPGLNHGMRPLPQTNMQPTFGYPPYLPPNSPIENGKHRSRQEKHQSQGRTGKKESGWKWRDNLTAAGMGGAAVSLLAVLSEAAAEF